MAKNLTDKLNTLLQSSVRGIKLPRSGRRGEAPAKLGKDVDRDIAMLREHVNTALDDEDRLEAGIGALQRQIADWDQQADRALAKGDEATSRHAIGQMQLLQQRLGMQEAELAEHRFSTGALISRVNELEAVVAEARRQQQSGPETNPAPDSFRARLNKVRDDLTAQRPAVSPDVPAVVDEQEIEADLARRRARLSQ